MKNSKKRFCQHCGRELRIIKYDTGKYNVDTGEREIIDSFERCNIKDCQHGYHNYKQGFIKNTCRDCGNSYWPRP